MIIGKRDAARISGAPAQADPDQQGDGGADRVHQQGEHRGGGRQEGGGGRRSGGQQRRHGRQGHQSRSRSRKGN